MTTVDENPAMTTDPALTRTTRSSRVERARMPLAADVVEAVAISHGVCIRPVPQRVTDTWTGDVTFVDVPCGATLASTCPPCAERARRLRVHQCREGWHLDTDPDLTADEPNADQMRLVIERADATAAGEALAGGVPVEKPEPELDW